MIEWRPIPLSFALTAVLTPLWRSLAGRRRFLDQPHQRSSHRRVTPVGVASPWGGWGVSLLTAPVEWTADRVGLWDDRFGLSPPGASFSSLPRLSASS